MALIKIDGQYIDIDVREELEQFDWVRPTWSDTKLIAASPFRYDKTPSFFCDLTTGGFYDSGAYDIDWERGNLPKLLAFLRDETYEETCESLIETYGIRTEQTGFLAVPNVRLIQKKPKIAIKESELAPYKVNNSDYLIKRGISAPIIEKMSVGYSERQRAVTIPWFHADGSLANVKYRKTYGKTFWYYKGGAPIRTLIYGIDQIYRYNIKEAIICEAEIDALSWLSCGKFAIAIGGTAITETQLEIIRKSPIETLIKAMDNDKPGEKLGRKLSDGLRGYVRLNDICVPSAYKDANEALVAGLDLSLLPVLTRDRIW